MEIVSCRVEEGEDGARIDRYLMERIDSFASRSAVQKLCENGNVTIAGNTVSKNYKVRSGEEIAVLLPDPVELDVAPEDIPLDVVYEDHHLLVVNKPKGMVVHPAPGHYSGTLVNALLFHCREELSGINGVIRPGIVHRIDKDTSGLLIVAKTDAAHLGLAEQIKVHSFQRQYEAVAYGGFSQDSGTIDAPIGRHRTDRKKMCVVTGPGQRAREAVTHYQVLERMGPFTHLPVSPMCGAVWRQGGPIRYGYTWPPSGIRWRGMRSTAPSRPSRSFMGSASTLGLSVFVIPLGGSVWSLTVRCRNIFKNF